jgi:hypothetical protein
MLNVNLERQWPEGSGKENNDEEGSNSLVVNVLEDVVRSPRSP